MLASATTDQPTNLARSHRRVVLASARLLSPSDLHIVPSPVRAATRSAKKIDISGLTIHSTSNALQFYIRNSDTVRGLTRRLTILVILLDNDAVIGDAGHDNVGVGDLRHGASGTGDSLDPNGVLGIAHGGVLNRDILDDVVGAVADRADGETVAANAGAAGEPDVL